ncbi:MAG TPA: glycosyltransferase family 87 protein [Gemmatimonadaceae bacterium]|nr:glycosyltransferase family 87 protein [Gemmatimonadaceae bacterium]
MSNESRLAARDSFMDATDLTAWWDRAIAWLIVAYVVAATFAWYTRAFTPHHHWTFPVFRESFSHLLAHRNLYAPDPAQGYDLFKYSPTFALLFAPFAIVPPAVGLLAWDLLNALVVFAAVRALLPRREAAIAALVLLPEVFVSAQASQSNALVAGLIVFAFLALERSRLTQAAIATGVGAAIKLFPLAAVTFALPYRTRWRFAWRVAVVGVVLVLLPLGVVSMPVLRQEYRWWAAIESVDALAHGASVMGLVADVIHGSWPNWPVQVAGTIVLLAPLVARPREWKDARFLQLYLCSLLVYVVLFNHQAERPSYVIAVTGVAIWFATSPVTRWRTALALATLLGLKAGPCLAVWVAIQYDLWTCGTDEHAVSSELTTRSG